MIEIRKMTKEDDVCAIAEIYAKSWKTAYHGIVPQSYLDAVDGDRWLPILKGDILITMFF